MLIDQAGKPRTWLVSSHPFREGYNIPPCVLNLAFGKPLLDFRVGHDIASKLLDLYVVRYIIRQRSRRLEEMTLNRRVRRYDLTINLTRSTSV